MASQTFVTYKLEKDLVDFFGLPENTIEFNIHAKVGELMIVDCKCFMTDKPLKILHKK